MNAAYIGKSNEVCLVVAPRTQVEVVPTAVTSTPLTLSVLSTLLSHKSRRRRNLDLVHRYCPLGQFLFFIMVAYVSRRPWGDVEVRADIIGNVRNLSL